MRSRIAACVAIAWLSGAASGAAWGGPATSPDASAAWVDGADPAYREELVARAVALGLDERRAWRLLVHTDDPLFGRPRSTAETARFFASPDGRRDPRRELVATLESFFEAAPRAGQDDPPQCAFVARFHWLDAQLDFDRARLPALPCANYARWRDGLGGSHLTLVFAESYIDSPASMFGHTLLRLDVEGDDTGLLGYAIDFTGDMGDDGLLQYVVKGVSGAYPGRFAVNPYYEKLKQYADWENRDVWEYPLDLDPREVDFVLMHLWELRGVSFPYYFFDDNCSYQLLRLLEVARPGSRLGDGFPVAVIPVDTVRALAATGFVDTARYRPSPATKLRFDAAALPRAHRRLARDVALGRRGPDDRDVLALPPRERAIVLSVAYESLRFDFLADGDDEVARSRSRRILVARSRLGAEVAGDPLARSVPAPAVRPDEGHGTMRVEAAGGWRDGKGYAELRFRAALHDFMDPQGGYPRGSQIQVLDTRVRYVPDGNDVRLERLVLLDVVSLAPRTTFFDPIAWKVGTGLVTRLVRESPRPTGRGFDPKPVFRANGGAGLAYAVGAPVVVYAFGDATLDAGPALEHDVSFGPGATAGAYVEWLGGVAKTHVFGGVTRFVAGDVTTWYRGGAEQRVSFGSWGALRLEGSANRSEAAQWYEAGASFSLYF